MLSLGFIMKLTKKDLQSLVVFNKNQKRIGEPKLSEEEYLFYLYGKGFKHLQVKKEKRVLKSKDIPSWAVDHRNISSITSNYIAVKNDDSYKKEVSKKYTISISYNKGNYAVIPNSEIQCIGKK